MVKYKLFLARKVGGSSSGRTAAFEAVNLGSNPSPPALRENGSCRMTTIDFLVVIKYR